MLKRFIAENEIVVEETVMRKREKVLKCYVCRRKMKKLNQVSTHIWKFHTEREDAFICNVSWCGNEFATGTLAFNHLQAAHSVAKKSKCEFCRKIFYGQTKLKKHVINKHVTRVSEVSEAPYPLLAAQKILKIQDRRPKFTDCVETGVLTPLSERRPPKRPLVSMYPVPIKTSPWNY